MRAIVTVFKSELKNRDFVKNQVEALCNEIRVVDDATIFSPKEGKLVEFLNVLKFYKVAYGTHFDTKMELVTK
jgi:hypothetical protein